MSKISKYFFRSRVSNIENLQIFCMFEKQNFLNILREKFYRHFARLESKFSNSIENFHLSPKFECWKLPDIAGLSKIFKYFTGLQCQKSLNILRDSNAKNLQIFAFSKNCKYYLVLWKYFSEIDCLWFRNILQYSSLENVQVFYMCENHIFINILLCSSVDKFQMYSRALVLKLLNIWQNSNAGTVFRSS